MTLNKKETENVVENYNIIGQDKLVQEIDRIFEIFVYSKYTIRPHFILTGPSGTGKTKTICEIAKAKNINFLQVDAGQITQEGHSGNSISKALSPLIQNGGQPIVIFVDEFDKLFISGNNNSEFTHDTKHAVQNEFLKILESESTSVFGDYGKYINVNIEKTLFIFGGAFNNVLNLTLEKLKSFGIKTEFLGRVGLLYQTQPLKLEHLYKILETSDILKKYFQLFKSSNKEEVIDLMKSYISKKYDKNAIGARMVNTIIHQYFIKGGYLEEETADEIIEKTLEINEKKT